ncbi:MAG: hypothetical protein MCM46_06365 [Candidatus Manganitrophus sp. SB1]|nr:hypothetical protein [Candidatus Manganitrophus morganii]
MFLFRKRFSLTIGMLLSISLLVYACGGGGGSSSGGGGGGTTPISNASQGSQAASSGTTGAQSGTALSDIASSLGSAAGGGVFGLSKPMSPFTKQNPKYAKIVAMNNKVARSKSMMKISNRMKAVKAKTSFAVGDGEAVDCTDGGTVTATGSPDSSGAFDLDLVFSDCREEGTQINGPVSMTATGNFDENTQAGILTMNMTLGEGSNAFSIQDYEEINGNAYANLVGVMESTMTLNTSFNMTSATAGSVTLAATGDASFDDFTETMNILFVGFEDESAFDETAGTFSNNLNGAITQSFTEDDGTHTTAISFTNMAVSATENDTGEAVSLSGTVAVNFTPDTDCGIEGTFSFQTVTPLQYDSGESCPVAGHLVINSNTNIEFNSDQSVDVTVGSETSSFASCDELFDICEVEDLEEDSDNVTVSGDTTTSGDSMLITLTWTDDGTDLSDMDLHVGYYSDPLATSGPADAVVHWQDTSATFGTAGAILDFDDTDGLGPEHVTVSSLPAGRYVIAVNSYDLADATSATVTVTVKIGDSVYSFPTHSFQVADGDGTTSAAWHRVVDLQCISGTCTLVAPNTSLMVHDGANGGFKPKKGK